MDKQQFNDLEVLKQLNYVNNELVKGESLRNISSNLGMSKTTIRDRFIKIGYIYNKELKQYGNDNNLEVQIHKSITKVPLGVQKLTTGGVSKGNAKELQKYDGDILELVKYKDDLLEMLKDYKSNTKIIDMQQLDINNLPEDLQKDIVNKSFKMYAPIYKLFDEVCSQYQGIKKQDLISLALLEFYNKYNKK